MAQHPLGAEIWFSEKIRFGLVKMSAYNLVCRRPKFTQFLCSTRN